MKYPSKNAVLERSDWNHNIDNYVELVNDDETIDSKYLRDEGLKKTIIELIGEPMTPVLDVGCGDGWLFDKLMIDNGIECDVVEHTLKSGRNVSVQDVQNLTFKDNSFLSIIASLVLMWVKDLNKASDELFRVAKPSCKLIVAVVHPYFYRTGKVNDKSQFVIEKDLFKPFIIDKHYIAEEIGPFVYYYRPLNEYVNTLIKSGWIIRNMKDWFLDIDDYNKKVKNKNKNIIRTNKVPMYSFIECFKKN